MKGISSITIQYTLLFIASVLSLGETYAGVKPIYGDDDRIEVYQSDVAMCNVASAVAAVFSDKSASRHNNQRWTIESGRNLLSENWCEEERFVTQQSGVLCTAFLIAANMMVTAGHCINAIGDTEGPGLNCNEAIFVFDYKLNRYDLLPTYFENDQIYRCALVTGGLVSSTSSDWRVIELDRIANRKILPVYSDPLLPAIPAKESTLDIVGHPLGLPMKVSRNGDRLTEVQDNIFMAGIDSYEGNSGSPVLTSIDGQITVVGVLSGGASDFELDDDKSCKYSRRCLDGQCTGEKVTFSSHFSGWAQLAHNSHESNWLYAPNGNCQ